MIAQLAFWASGVLVEQVVLLIANSVLPVEGALVNIRLPNPVFVTVTAWALLVVPTGCGISPFSYIWFRFPGRPPILEAVKVF